MAAPWSGVFSVLGQGGGVLYTPIQVWAGIDFHVAATTSLFLIMVMSLSASIVFRKAIKIDWPLVLVLESSTAPGGFAAGLASGMVGVGGGILKVPIQSLPRLRASRATTETAPLRGMSGPRTTF